MDKKGKHKEYDLTKIKNRKMLKKLSNRIGELEESSMNLK